MKEFDCFLFQYFRQRREAKSELSNNQKNEAGLVVSGNLSWEKNILGKLK